jgi:hypothetical protein
MIGLWTARVAAVALAVIVAGCGTDPTPQAQPSARRPSAPELVRDAQQAIRTASTGHYEYSALALMDDGWVPWQQHVGDYDLQRQVWIGELRLSNSARGPRVAGWTYTSSVIGTTEATYAKSVQAVDDRDRRWHRTRAQPDSAADLPSLPLGVPFPVSAVLAFRPDGTQPDDDGDSWTVTGTLPPPVALLVVAALSGGPSSSELDERHLRATGTAVARLVVGADRTVRELHVAGVDVDVTSELAAGTREPLPRQSGTIKLSAYGKPVTVRMPPPEEVTDDPAPAMQPVS